MPLRASAEELEAASNAVYERTRATYPIKGFAKGEADRAQIEACLLYTSSAPVR